jgi:hypothetical protein
MSLYAGAPYVGLYQAKEVLSRKCVPLICEQIKYRVVAKLIVVVLLIARYVLSTVLYSSTTTLELVLEYSIY